MKRITNGERLWGKATGTGIDDMPPSKPLNYKCCMKPIESEDQLAIRVQGELDAIRIGLHRQQLFLKKKAARDKERECRKGMKSK